MVKQAMSKILDTADLTVCRVQWVLFVFIYFLQGSLHLSSWSDLQQTYVGRWEEVCGVQNLFLELETRPRTEQFKPHLIVTFLER